MKKASWILLAILGVLILAGSVVSATLAYGTNNYPIGPASITDVAAGRAPVATALRGIRGTSAAYAAAYGVFFLAVVLGPYRRGEVWAWWTLLAAGLTLLAVVAARVPALGTQLGLGAAAVQAGVLVVGLLLDVGRIKGASR